jgi:hypothetical protein
MQNITIGRYEHSERPPRPGVTDIADLYAGWIEGTREDGSTWIMWLDADGNPEQYWAQRDEGGGVEGEPIML